MCCIMPEKPLEGGTIPSGWSDPVWIACLLPHLVSLGCVGLLELLVAGYTRSRFSTVGYTVGPTSCLLLCLCKTLLSYCLWPLELSCPHRGLGTLLRQEKLLLVPDSLYAACFLALTRTLLQCACLTKRPILILTHL